MVVTRQYLFLVLVSVVLLGCSQPSTPAPTSYTKWSPNEAYFHLEYPEGWKAEGGGKQGIQWAEFSQGNCKISASTDLAGSLIGDIVGSAGQLGGGIAPLDQETAEKLAPVARVHEMKLQQLPAEFKSFKEKSTEAFKSALGDGRKSEFTATMGMGRRVKGYRATVLALNRGVTIFCHCPEGEWSKFQPAYDKVLESLTAGGL